MIKNTVFAESEEVFFGGLQTDIHFWIVDSLVEMAFLWTVSSLSRRVAAKS